MFNWLYARHCGGTFLVRVEDTDRERSTKDAVDVIFEGLAWLGLEPDAPPVFQAQQVERHKEVVGQLLAAGRAYRCYMTVEELDEERAKARAEGRVVRSPWRDQPPPAGSNAPHVIRFKGPTEGETLVDDMIKGPIRFANRDLDDLVLLRSDGTPTYNVAVVVDDHDMAVTHIIRGDDHLNNAARQTLIYRALNWTVPAFAHLPLIHGPDGAKLSKRHGAQAVGEFAEMGYLPEAMRNYLARLGWGHGDDEIFTDAQAIEWFDVADVVKAPARLDWAKLGFINNHYLRAIDETRLLALAADAHAKRGVTLDAEREAALARAVTLVKDGAKTVLELADLTAFTVLQRPFAWDDKLKGLLTAETAGRLGRLRERLGEQSAAEGAWSVGALNAVLRSFAESEGVGLGKFGPALRGVLSGGASAPDLASALSSLGAAESLARLDDALSHLQ